MKNKKAEKNTKSYLDKVAILTLTILASYFIINNMSNKSNTNLISERINYDKSTSFSILSANVGNLSVGCRDVLNKLCYKDVEARISSNIHYLSPDVIALQEVLAPWQCTNINAMNKNKVCSEMQVIPQVRRLVGENYTIVCNSRNQFECIAIKKDFGEIVGCQSGEICHTARTIPEIEGCDNGFTISAATIKTKTPSLSFDLVNFHPQSTSSICREKMIKAAFYGNNTTPSIIQEKKLLLLGDFNFDPWRDNDESVATWKNFFNSGWNGEELKYHSGIAEAAPPYFTSFLFYKPRTLDFIVSNFTTGICQTLGETPNTLRLDGGKGMDHRALFGILTVR
jgi:hypothetical protein